MKHFARQEDIVMMAHTYLQILQQDNIDLNLSYLMEMSSSSMEDYGNVFSHGPLDSQYILDRLHLAPTHVDLFLQSICTP